MIFSVSTTAPSITLELDVWQSPRVAKVPFKIRTRLGLGGRR